MPFDLLWIEGYRVLETKPSTRKTYKFRPEGALLLRFDFPGDWMNDKTLETILQMQALSIGRVV